MDPDRHVLLFQYEDDRGRWWATPGGKLEEGETYAEGAAREAVEEIGLMHIMAEPRPGIVRANPFASQGVAPMRIVAIDHVQLAMPSGGEDAARAFYGGVLGLQEVPKPSVLAGRGGAWFQSGAVQLHLGVEADFRPARKAHPALQVEGLAVLVARCEAAGHSVIRDVALDGMERVHVADPFGNRIELLELLDHE